MTRKLLVLALPILLFVFAFTANAQDASTGSVSATDAATKLKQQMRLVQEQKNAAVSKVTDEAKTDVLAKQNEFILKLQAIKDQRKKALLEKIYTQIQTINIKYVNRLNESLNNINMFLSKLVISPTNKSSDSELSSAQSVIDTAHVAVQAQMSKTYIVTITDDSTLKQNAGTTVKQFRQDIANVHKLVVAAKQAVQKLYANNAQIKNEATGSAKL